MQWGGILIRWASSSETFGPDTGVTVGRDPACTVVLDDPTVSLRHARLDGHSGTWTLTDLGSTQGTWVDGQRVSQVTIDRETSVIFGRATGTPVRFSPIPPATITPDWSPTHASSAEDTAEADQPASTLAVMAHASAPQAPPGTYTPAGPPSQAAPPPPPPPLAVHSDRGVAGSDLVPDPRFLHFLRYLGVVLTVVLTTQLLFVGVVWMLLILDRTGHRKRDYFTFVLPHRAIWRYTARSVYWHPRDDRPSDILRRWQRPGAVVFGYGLLAAVTAVIGLGLAGSDAGWTALDREVFKTSLQKGGHIGDEASQCWLDRMMTAFPDGPPDTDDPRFGAVVRDAVAAC